MILTEHAKSLFAANVDVGGYQQFLQTFPLQGERLYEVLFHQHSDSIQTQKLSFAVANLQKIMAATFTLSTSIGFSRMSLRDLSRATGMSMGAIYSCIQKKEDIVLMVLTVVNLSSQLTEQHANKATSRWEQFKELIRFHLYASSILQPWYFFLFFETRSLSENQQLASTNIELAAINGFEAQIGAGIEAGEFNSVNARAVANAVVVLLEDWYLKPWKNHIGSALPDINEQYDQRIDTYFDELISLAAKLLLKDGSTNQHRH